MFRKLLPALLVATTALPAAAVLTVPAMAQSLPADPVRVRGSVISLGDKRSK